MLYKNLDKLRGEQHFSFFENFRSGRSPDRFANPVTQFNCHSFNCFTRLCQLEQCYRPTSGPCIWWTIVCCRSSTGLRLASDCNFSAVFFDFGPIVSDLFRIAREECEQCDDLAKQVSSLKDALAQAEGLIADLRAER